MSARGTVDHLQIEVLSLELIAVLEKHVATWGPETNAALQQREAVSLVVSGLIKRATFPVAEAMGFLHEILTTVKAVGRDQGSRDDR